MLTFQEETFSQAIPEGRRLLNLHWHEVARDQERIGLLPRFDRYERAEDAGSLLIVTARDDGALVGYAVFFIDKNLHYAQSTWGISDIFWLHPDARRGRAGMRLLLFAEERLRARGAEMMHTTTKIEHPAASRLLQFLGHIPIETVHAKFIGGD